MKAYIQGKRAAEVFHIQERRNSSYEERWQQLNAAYNLAFSMGMTASRTDEMDVYLRWARLKDAWMNQQALQD